MTGNGSVIFKIKKPNDYRGMFIHISKQFFSTRERAEMKA